MPSPAVSVIIPTYNRERLLARALDSVIGQTVDDFEVLVVDDGSTDGTAGLVNGYAARDGRVRYLRQPENGGVAEARNRGLREARANLIAFLDSDDVWVADKLARQVALFRELPDRVGLLYGGVREVYVEDGQGGGRRPAPKGRRETFVPMHRGDVYRQMLQGNVLYGTSGVMVRRAAVEAAGQFRREASPSEDYDYWIRVARHFEVDFIADPLVVYYNVESDDRLSLNVSNVVRARAWIFQTHEAEMRRLGTAHLFLLQTARRHLEASNPDLRAVRRLAWEAVQARPGDLTAYRMLVRSVAPAPVVRAGRRAVRSGRAWVRRAGRRPGHAPGETHIRSGSAGAGF